MTYLAPVACLRMCQQPAQLLDRVLVLMLGYMARHIAC